MNADTSIYGIKQSVMRIYIIEGIQLVRRRIKSKSGKQLEPGLYVCLKGDVNKNRCH